MNGQAFYDYVLQILKRDDKESEVFEATRDVINELILNNAFGEFETETEYTIPQGSGEHYIALPADFALFVSDVKMRDTASSFFPPLKKITKDEYDRLLPNPLDDNMKGEPLYYCVFGNKIYLWPRPDKYDYVYTICYAKKLTVTPTQQSTDIPFTDMHREMIRAGVLMRIFAPIEPELATMYQNFYINFKNEAILNNERAKEAPGFVKTCNI